MKSRHFLNTVLLLLIAAGISLNACAEHALPEFSARYAVQKFDIKLAEAHYNLAYTETGYRFTHNTKLFGLASLFASDTVDAMSLVDRVGDNLLLKKFVYTQTGREKNKDEDIGIHWNTFKNTLKGKISGVSRSNKLDLETDTEIWDILSFQIPLMIEVDEEIKEYPYKALISGEINEYNFVLSANKEIEFADSSYPALLLVNTDSERNRQLHIWVIPELYNIPVVIENYRDGKLHSRMQLESVTFNHDETYREQETDIDDDF